MKYIKTIKIMMLLLLCSSLGFSQELPSIDFTPAPEDAFQFTKYGNVPVNESSGRINLNIPLFTYVAGNLVLPVNLSYTGNGVRVNQNPTDTGMNWNLNAGGMITRIVYDRRDEASQGYYLSKDALDNMDLQDNSNDATLLNLLINPSEVFDSERDEFSFSFFGYSGIFYLDDNDVPVVADKSSNIKIEMVSNGLNNEFLITLPTGDKFYFGGQDYLGISLLKDNDGNVLKDAANTVFYLYKAESYLGDIILFDYEDYGKQELVSFNQKITYHNPLNKQYHSPCDPCGFSASTNCDECTVPITGEPGTFRCPDLGRTMTSLNPKIFTQVFNFSLNKRLIKIHAPALNRFIEFNFQYVSPSLNKKLISIDYKTNTNSINKIDLEYQDTFIGGVLRRFFLNKVTLHNHLSSSFDDQKQVFQMVYDDPESLPNQFSFEQDFFGYYNGATGNSYLETFIPKNEHYYFKQLNATLADRTVSFEHAKKGTLKKMIYPTGGFTLFEYEAPKVKEARTDKIKLEINNIDQVDIKFAGFDPVLNTPTNDTYYVFEDQTISIDFNITTDGNHTDDHIRGKLTITDYNAVGGISLQQQLISPLSTSLQYNLLKDHLYQFRLEYENLPANYNTSAVITAEFDIVVEYQEVDGFGIRIKRTSDYSVDNLLTDSKRYYYKKAININEIGTDSYQLNVTPTGYNNQAYSDVVVQLCRDNLNCWENWWRRDILEYSSSRNGFPDLENQVLYNYVTISEGGDNFEKGGIEKKFLIKSENNFQEYHTPTRQELYSKSSRFTLLGSNDVTNGKLLNERILLKKNNGLKIIQDKQYTYDLVVDTFLSNFTGDLHEKCNVGDRGYTNLYVGTYTKNIYKNNLLNQITTDYIEPLSLDGDPNTVKKIVNTINYEYGALAGLPIKIISTNSDGVQSIIKNYYPPQVVTISSLNLQPALSSDELLAINNLKSNVAHRISTPIQTEIYEKSNGGLEVMLSAQRNLYQINSNGFTQLKSVLSSKNSSDFEGRIYFNSYDDNGNPIEVKKADGVSTVYLWGTNHRKPLAKIVNATHYQVSNASGDLRLALPNALVTTYTYEGLLDLLSSSIDPKGNKTTYHYDSLNRLEFVKDKDNNILSENKYHYKN
ncbi:hypothetical protein FIA58_021040 [Flavobacterium jejuense]|uniref:YD repeat-containing protein n=1 Tax=Flavobacterium jejuense TaxID=1544455 RepID=A0ABX0IZQ6_9FLAO|nr:hypothetical protein [Flavobacterium jejuense]NHN28167.1 hypothetical protein [Flavobacterium jejuense]